MSAARLERARQILAAQDGELARWFEAGLARGRSGEDLRKALSITAADGARARDEALLNVAQLLDPRSELRPWRRAGEVLQALEWYARERWPSHDVRHDPSPLERALRDAFVACANTGAPPIPSERTIFRLLTRVGSRVSRSVDGRSDSTYDFPKSRGATE